MATSLDPKEIEREALNWYKRAKGRYENTENGTQEETQAIQAVSLAALTALTAEQIQDQRKRR